MLLIKISTLCETVKQYRSQCKQKRACRNNQKQNFYPNFWKNRDQSQCITTINIVDSTTIMIIILTIPSNVLCVGDLLLSLNNADCSNLTQHQIVQVQFINKLIIILPKINPIITIRSWTQRTRFSWK